jgi:hypothetical protein
LPGRGVIIGKRRKGMTTLFYNTTAKRIKFNTNDNAMK